jgi:hypothetical protein
MTMPSCDTVAAAASSMLHLLHLAGWMLLARRITHASRWLR